VCTLCSGSPRVLSRDAAELVVPVGFPVQRLLLQAGDRVALRLVVNPEVSGLRTENTELRGTRSGLGAADRPGPGPVPRPPSSGSGRCCSSGSRSRHSPTSEPPGTGAGPRTTRRPASPGRASRSRSVRHTHTQTMYTHTHTQCTHCQTA